MTTRSRFSEADQNHGPVPRTDGDLPWAALRKAWRAIGRRIPDMGYDMSWYAAVQADRARLAASQMLTRLTFRVLQVLAAVTVFAIAASLVIAGIAGGVTSALNGNVWLADLITGMAVILLLTSAITIGLRMHKSDRLRRLKRKYERHEMRHRAMVATNAGKARNHAQ